MTNAFVIEDGPTTEDVVVPSSPAVTEVTKEGARVRIQLEENDEIPPTGQFFGVNGKGYILRPGEPANVPLELLHVLDNAVRSVPVKDGSDQVIGYRDRLRFPYRVLGDARAAS